MPLCIQYVVKKTVVNTTFVVMGFSLITRLLAFLFKVYLSRTLGAEALGLFSMGLAMFGLLTMLPSSGIPTTVSRRVAEYTAQNKRANGIVTSGLLLSLAVNIATVAAFLLFKNQLLNLFADQRCEKVILIMLPATFSTCIYNVLRAYFMGRRYYVAYSITETVEEILNIVVVLVLVYGGFVAMQGGEVLATAFLCGDVACFVLIAIMYAVLRGGLGKPTDFKGLFGSSAPITLMRLFTSLAATFTAVILPNRMVAGGATVAQSTAQYGQAVGMAYPLLFAPLALTSALSVVLLPELATLSAIGKKREIAQKFDTAALFVLLITTYFFVLFAVLGRSLGILVFASEQAGQFVSFGAGMVIPLCLAQLVNTSLNSLAMEMRCFVYSMVGLAAMALCLWFLPQLLGVYALAVAQTVFYLITVVLGCITLAKHGYTDTAFAAPFCKVAIGALCLAGAGVAIRNSLAPYIDDLWLTILLGVVLTLGYAALILGTKAINMRTIWTMVRGRNTKKSMLGV